MKKSLTAKTSITINASPLQIWKALTTPRLIKKYLMGTDVESNWTEGSPITYSGEYNGKKYNDKGVIRRMDPGKIFQSTYWSSNSGKEDKSENYNLVTYELSKKGDRTRLTLLQDNIRSEKEKAHSTENWKMVLKKLKQVVENKI